MCKLIVATKKPVKNNDFTKLLTAQFKEVKEQKDGLAILTIDKNNKLKVDREFKHEEYDYLLWKLIDKVDDKKTVMIHSRKGTSGDTVLGNVHFFKNKGNYFAQNGFVGDYDSYKQYGYNSSYKKSLFDDDEAEEMIYNSKNKKGFKKVSTLTNRIAEIENKCDKLDEKISSFDMILETCPECADAFKCYCNKHSKVFDTRACYVSKQDSLEMEGDLLKKRRMEILGKKFKGKDIPKLLAKNNVFQKCDTLQFFEGLKNPINIKSLSKAVEDKKHTGSSVLINEKTFKTYFIAGINAKVIYNDDFTVLFSYYPSLKTTITKDYDHKGILIEEEIDIDLDFKKHDIKRGVYQFKV